MSVRQISELSEEQRGDLHRFYQNEWWTEGRNFEGVETMLTESDLIVAFSDSDTDELVAFSWVLTDAVYKALIFDVIVPSNYRDEGLGRKLMDAIIDHPALSQVEHFELYCLDEIVPFYEKWGFTDDLGDLRLLRREQ
ncbi:GNAT family N-acetyltransferase [halophilic archaeon]|nr:GNAT family N-acetyltransferase [halophilic archaeon]